MFKYFVVYMVWEAPGPLQRAGREMGHILSISATLQNYDLFILHYKSRFQVFLQI